MLILSEMSDGTISVTLNLTLFSTSVILNVTLSEAFTAVVWLVTLMTGTSLTGVILIVTVLPPTFWPSVSVKVMFTCVGVLLSRYDCVGVQL